MSSGSYFPRPVRRVDLPKGDGRTRTLGIPTVSDRGAQEVVKRYLEPILEPIFQHDCMDTAPADRRSTPPSRRPDGAAGGSTGCAVTNS